MPYMYYSDNPYKNEIFPCEMFHPRVVISLLFQTGTCAVVAIGVLSFCLSKCVPFHCRVLLPSVAFYRSGQFRDKTTTNGRKQSRLNATGKRVYSIGKCLIFGRVLFYRIKRVAILKMCIVLEHRVEKPQKQC